VETVGKIRRWYRVEGKSISEIAKRLGASRNTVKKYLRSGVIVPRYKPRPKRAPVIGAWIDRLQQWLAFDEQRPRKERRTAQRMFELLRAEGYGGSYVTVQRFVRAWRSALAGIVRKGESRGHRSSECSPTRPRLTGSFSRPFPGCALCDYVARAAAAGRRQAFPGLQRTAQRVSGRPQGTLST